MLARPDLCRTQATPLSDRRDKERAGYHTAPRPPSLNEIVRPVARYHSHRLKNSDKLYFVSQYSCLTPIAPTLG